jgi:hypothetical protein
MIAAQMDDTYSPASSKWLLAPKMTALDGSGFRLDQAQGRRLRRRLNARSGDLEGHFCTLAQSMIISPPPGRNRV